MPTRPPPIGSIRLARSWPRLLALPALLVALGVSMAAVALLLLGDPLRYVVAATAAIPVLAGVMLGVRMATMRADVEEATVRVHWLGGGRVYALVPGPVTRVRLRGEQASALRSRGGFLGWQFGAATLRDEEPIEVVRLAPTRTAILVPTDRGRLAIAAASEPELLEALSRAARARARLEDRPDLEPPAIHAGGAEDGAGRDSPAGGEQDEAPAIPELTIETPPHILTGIERAMLDERLARERLESEAAEREQAEAEAIARADAERAAVEEAALLATRASDGTDVSTTATAGLRTGPIPSLAFVLLPLGVTLGLWAVALSLERLPAGNSDIGRVTALALVVAGPGTSIAAIMARTWWPRLVGVVVTSGLAAAVFIGRALFGA
jgi:hypothetical protein